MTLRLEQLERREVLSTFTLHSNPGADHTVHLDFDGHVTEGTAWNNVPCGCLDQIVTPPYSTDADPAFNANELSAIEEMFARVAEDFRPFDVDVTTEEVANEQTVVIGGSSSDWSGSSAGGLSFLNSFGSGNPAFVFENNFSGGLAIKGIAEAISHETGHTLGLGHDGTTTQSYYAGHGNGETGWAPIMGIGSLRNLTQWSQGEYPGATNQQDDVAVIAAVLGFRADDHGDRRNQATPFDGSLASGIITTRDDVDYFSFSTTGGTVMLQADPAAIGPNLDIGLKLYRNGKLIAESNPLDDLSASLTVTVGPGNYYVEVDGVGRPDTGDGHHGYSDYGSLGEYTLSGTIDGFSELRRIARRRVRE